MALLVNLHGILLWKTKTTSQLLFQFFLDKSGRKPNKIWVDKRSEFYNHGLHDNDNEIYSIHNEGKTVTA